MGHTKMKLIMEKWRRYANKIEEKQSVPTQTALIVWNDPNYRPSLIRRKLSRIIQRELRSGQSNKWKESTVEGWFKWFKGKSLKDWINEDMPIGHGGVILCRKQGDASCEYTSLQFGQINEEDTKTSGCPSNNNLYAIKNIGVFTSGAVTGKSILPNLEEVDVFSSQDLDSSILEILSKIETGYGIRNIGALQMGFVTDIDWEAAYDYGTDPMCRLYSVIPHPTEKMMKLFQALEEKDKKLLGFDNLKVLAIGAGLTPKLTDNCGSYMVKVAAHALGKQSTAQELVSNASFVAPDQVLPALTSLGVDFSLRTGSRSLEL